MARKNIDSWSKNYSTRLLIFGIMMAGFGIYQSSTLITFKRQLTYIKGVIHSADNYVTTVKEGNRGTKSQKSELIFYIVGRQQKFRLVENIGSDYRNEEFDKIKIALNRADSVKVWVKRSELNAYEPKIFQIDSDGKTVLEFERVRTKDSGLTLFLLFLGIGSLTLYFYSVYPEKFKKLLSDTEYDK